MVLQSVAIAAVLFTGCIISGLPVWRSSVCTSRTFHGFVVSALIVFARLCRILSGTMVYGKGLMLHDASLYGATAELLSLV